MKQAQKIFALIFSLIMSTISFAQTVATQSSQLNINNASVDIFAKDLTTGEYTGDTVSFRVINPPIKDAAVYTAAFGDSDQIIKVPFPTALSTIPTLNQTLINGNNTRQRYIVDDSSITNTTSLVHWQLKPSNYMTDYGTRGSAMGLRSSYVRYNGVNSSGRPNVVWDIFSYNGGFNSPKSNNEAAFRFGFESHFETGGANLFEFHTGEFKPRGSAISFRIGTYYMDKDNGNTVYSQQISQYTKYFGGLTTLGDSVNFGVNPKKAVFGYRGTGSLSMVNQQIPAENYNQTLVAGGGVNYDVASPTPSTTYFNFTSPATFKTTATTGTGIQSAIQASVGTANYAALRIVQANLSTSDFYGLFSSSINTSGTYTVLHGQNTNAAGMVRTSLIAQNGATAAYHLRDATVGIDWSIGKITSGDVNRSMKISFGTTTYDSLLKFNGAGAFAGQAKFRYSVAIGANEANASSILDMQSTSKGVLLPRMTKVQRNAIASPATGLLIWQTDNTPGLRCYNGTNWIKFSETDD